ncbi:MAG TPA: hypothetical protein VNO14_01720 [Blastocatellia bacterium]|nr:hypothetical protein [Blastocatellia bacterium]
MPAGQIDVLMKVVSALEGLGIKYLVGGSFASSAYGIPRATMDVDLLASIRPEHAGPLATELSPEFFVDDRAIERAAKEKRSFNVIHLESMFKVDVFVAEPEGFNAEQLERRRKERIGDDPEQTIYIATAEDIILAKLDWYRKGGEVSEQQWRDILGVVRVQGDGLDREYLDLWAKRLGVDDLLDRALMER